VRVPYVRYTADRIRQRRHVAFATGRGCLAHPGRSVALDGRRPGGAPRNAERHWFQEVVARVYPDLPWDEGRPPYDPAMPFTCDRPSKDVLGYYREQCDRTDEVLAGVSLSDRPRGRHRGEEIPSVSVVILYIIEETAAHLGHLEIAREFLDSATGPGLRRGARWW
jgi:Protein of unknown function (DUF664)